MAAHFGRAQINTRFRALSPKFPMIAAIPTTGHAGSRRQGYQACASLDGSESFIFLHRRAADADQNRRLASAMGRLRMVLGSAEIGTSVLESSPNSHHGRLRKCVAHAERCSTLAQVPKDVFHRPMLWLQHLSRFHSRHCHGSIKRRWGCRNVWIAAIGMMAGLD